MYLLAPPDPVDPEQVDVAMRPEYVAALDVAVAAVTALDTLRGGAVIAAFGRAQRATVEQFAALVAAKTGVPGAA